MSRYTPAHARDGQYRDAIRARARDTWTRLRAWVRRLASPEFGHMALPFDYTALRAEIAAIRPPSGSGAVRAGATTTPGAVNANSGTRQGPAGMVPARQPEAGAPPAPAAAPAPPSPKAPGPGQHSPDRAAPAGQGDCRQALPATRGQRLGDLVILPGACAWDPDRSRISRLTAPGPCAETGAMEAAP